MAEDPQDEALVPAPQGTMLSIGPFYLSAMSVAIQREPTFDEWQGALQFVQQLASAASFWLGDLLEMGEQRWGEKYSQALEATEFAEKTLRNAAWVARQIPPERRRMSPLVTYAHHAEVAGLDPEQQEYWLRRTEDERLSRDQLRVAIRMQRNAETGFVGDFWIVVKCTDEADQLKTAERMRNEGREVKVPVGRHR